MRANAALALCLIAGFLFSLWKVAENVGSWLRVRGWPACTATVTGAELVSHHGKTGMTYSTRVRFEYESGGVRHSSDSLHPYSKLTSGDGWMTYHELDRARRKGTQVPCRVNPGNSGEAYLTVDFPGDQICFFGAFTILLGACGVGLGVSDRRDSLRKRELSRRRRRFPDQPWMHRKDWAENWIEPTTATETLRGLFLVTCLTAFAGPLLFFIPRSVIAGTAESAALLGLVFPVLALGGWIHVTVLFLRWRRFDGSGLELSDVPGVPGERLSGIVFLSSPVPPGTVVEVGCRCRAEGWNERKGKRSRFVVDHWIATSRVPARSERNFAAFPIEFELPSGLPDSRGDTSSSVRWVVRVSAEIPGVDLDASFEIPVFSPR